MKQVKLYDTTLRDGAQQEGISFSVQDKIKITRMLDELGVDYIEGGWPGSNPKDAEFFNKAKELSLHNSTIAVFGSTRHHAVSVEEDTNLEAILKAGYQVATLVGKSWDLHVTKLLEIALDENLKMVFESIAYLKSKGLKVFFDAEHFFDGFRNNADYAIEVIKAADAGGADCIILCDTNGGALPEKVSHIVDRIAKLVKADIGIHAHNDGELAVANTLTAVLSGATQVQGTINGYGERCGNANLCSIIPNLKLKMNVDCISEEQLKRLTIISHDVAELANLSHPPNLPYVGISSFTHKAGFHVSGLMKWEDSYQHIAPQLVGNSSRVLVSELSGISNIFYKARERGLDFEISRESARHVVEQIKLLESRGFQYDNAEASFELLIRRSQPDYHPPFELIDFLVVVEKRRRVSSYDDGEEMLSEATVKVRVEDRVIHTAAEGNGPVNALDLALRKALVEFYPSLKAVKLEDYKVRILDENAATGAQVRVLIESTDGKTRWRTVGSSTNIIEASWLALADSMEYWLLKR